jgi:integrase
MASVKTLLDEKGDIRGYRVRWRDSGGHSRCGTFTKGQKAAANAFAVKVEADKIAGNELDPRGARLSVADYVREWTAVQMHRRNSAQRVTYALAPLLELIGDRPLIKIRQSDIRGWMKARAAEVNTRTLRSDWTWIRAIFRAAVADKLRPDNPCDGLTLPKAEKRRMTLPSLEGVLTIEAALPPSWAFIAPLGARTGLRPAELLGLCVEQVDFLRAKELRVDRQLSDGQIVTTLKTPSSARVVPLDDETVELLTLHLVVNRPGPPVSVVNGGGATVGEGRLVFHDGRGRPLVHRSVDATWRQAAFRAGQAGVRLHDMRHFYASNALAAGLSVAEVAELLGHSRPSITADMYAHPLDTTPARARAAVASIWQAG